MRSAADSPVPTSASGSPSIKRIAEGETQDPVCGMKNKASEIAFQETYQGKMFSFCSKSCRDKFLADLEKYAGVKAHIAGIPGDQAADHHD
jgi:YHS domain-containing protein